jgi:hypothetical protein
MGTQSAAFLLHIPLRRSRIRLVLAENCDRRFCDDSRNRLHSVSFSAGRHGRGREWGASADRILDANSSDIGRLGRGCCRLLPILGAFCRSYRSFLDQYICRTDSQLSVAAKKGASLAGEREPAVRLRYGLLLRLWGSKLVESGGRAFSGGRQGAIPVALRQPLSLPTHRSLLMIFEMTG